MASGPVTAWQIEGEKVKVVTDFLFLGSKITEDVDCSHEIRRQLLLGRKAMTNLDRVLKSRDITLLTKIGIGLSKRVTCLHQLTKILEPNVTTEETIAFNIEKFVSKVCAFQHAL